MVLLGLFGMAVVTTFGQIHALRYVLNRRREAIEAHINGEVIQRQHAKIVAIVVRFLAGVFAVWIGVLYLRTDLPMDEASARHLARMGAAFWAWTVILRAFVSLSDLRAELTGEEMAIDRRLREAQEQRKLARQEQEPV